MIPFRKNLLLRNLQRTTQNLRRRPRHAEGCSASKEEVLLLLLLLVGGGGGAAAAAEEESSSEENVGGVKLTARLHVVLRLSMLELYVHSSSGRIA
jgi:hypothetical protein